MSRYLAGSTRNRKQAMIDWISKKQREQKRKEEHEKALRESLAEKVSRYEREHSEPPEQQADQDYTELLVDGKKLRVAKQVIDVTDV